MDLAELVIELRVGYSESVKESIPSSLPLTQINQKSFGKTDIDVKS